MRPRIRLAGIGRKRIALVWVLGLLLSCGLCGIVTQLLPDGDSSERAATVDLAAVAPAYRPPTRAGLTPTLLRTASPEPTGAGPQETSTPLPPTSTRTPAPTATAVESTAVPPKATVPSAPRVPAAPVADPASLSGSLAAIVQIDRRCSNLDSPGNDHKSLNQEIVCFTNSGGAPVDMTNWGVIDRANHRYYFPPFVLSPGATVQLHTGSGADTATELYWGSSNAIWNNDGDTVSLHDSTGQLVDEYEY